MSQQFFSAFLINLECLNELSEVLKIKLKTPQLHLQVYAIFSFSLETRKKRKIQQICRYFMQSEDEAVLD